MTRSCLLFACCAAALLSCNDAGEGDKNADEEDQSPVKCYSYANSRDTISLTLIPVGESVTGTLEYSLDGKDRNKGTIQGVIRDELLVADYTFMSEGLRSVRQVAFLKKDSFYIEGYGKIEVTGNQSRFRNTDSLWYNDSIRLLETDCN